MLAFRLDKSILARKFYKGCRPKPLGAAAPKTPLEFRILPRNDGILDGILNEIASSFVSLTPRNDGISAMTEF